MLLGAFGIMVAQAALGAIDLTFTDLDAERAIGIATDSEAVRMRFHAPYIIEVGDATVERVEVITEFRRLVLTAEDHLKLGNWLIARGGYDRQGRTMKDALLPWKGRVSISVRLRFHPQNTYGELPPSESVLGEPPIASLDVIRTPIHAIASGDRPGSFSPLMGAVVETVFDAAIVGQRNASIRVMVSGQEVTRLTVDFSRLE
jgi:hypothetical protein